MDPNGFPDEDTSETFARSNCIILLLEERVGGQPGLVKVLGGQIEAHIVVEVDVPVIQAYPSVRAAQDHLRLCFVRDAHASVLRSSATRDDHVSAVDSRRFQRVGPQQLEGAQ
eukprot:scaffold7358_cov252-Pinguiococcus_pyrenoidosus.AAC.4